MNSIKITKNFLTETNSILRKFGHHGCEGLVLWLGDISNNSAIVKEIMTPPQKSIKSAHGVGYLVTGDTIFSINKYLHSSGLRLIAQIHSHPSDAYHSEADDLLAVATKEGSFSLVVPDFARGPADLNHWAVYQLRGGRWKEVSNREKNMIFAIERNGIEEVKSLKRRWWQWK